MPAAMIGIGFSSGGLPIVRTVLRALPEVNRSAVVLVGHLPAGASEMASVMRYETSAPVTEADDKLRFEPGNVYTAPGGFHLLVEDRHHFALSVDERVSHSRPSVTVFFESASEVFGDKFTAVVLSGANGDGAAALPDVRRRGGRILVQDPASATFPQMPGAAIAAEEPDEVLEPKLLAERIKELVL